MSKLQLTAIALGFTSILSQSALADQCAYVSEKQALAFAKQIHVGDTVYKLCEPCGQSTETGDRQAIEVKSIGYQKTGTLGYGRRGLEGKEYYQVMINGKGIDLAYTYKKTASLDNNNMALTNAAALVGCPTSGVSAFFTDLED